MTGNRHIVCTVLFCMCTTHLSARTPGYLSVSTYPEEIEVWLDEKYIGDSPIDIIRLDEGSYRLRLIDPVRRNSASEDVLIRPGDTTIVRKTLTAKFGSVRITTDPGGAVVSIAGNLGTTPLNNDFMAPGRYRLKIEHPHGHYDDLVEDVTIRRGEVLTLSRTLERKNPFDRRALIRLGLGAGAGLSFVWALIEHGTYRENRSRAANPALAAEAKNYTTEGRSAFVRQIVALSAGALCIIGFEIAAFF